MNVGIARLKIRTRLRFPRTYEAVKALRRTTRERKRALRSRSAEDVFTEIYTTNGWRSPESMSGGGSTLVATTELRAALPRLLADLDVRTLIDAPCGDFNWMQHAELGIERYIGADVVPALVDELNRRHAHGHREFIHLDLTRDALPHADALFCRDLLLHLSFADIERVKQNFINSDCRYLIVSTYPEVEVHFDILTGEVRPVNVLLPPFNWPQPVDVLVDDADEHMQRRMGVWRRDQFDAAASPPPAH